MELLDLQDKHLEKFLDVLNTNIDPFSTETHFCAYISLCQKNRHLASATAMLCNAHGIGPSFRQGEYVL